MEASHDEPDSGPAIGWLERTCELLCECALVIMMVMIAVDVVARTVFGVSFEVSDEIGAYLLVAITFLSLSVCLATNALHHVELIQAKLSPLARAASKVVFDVLALVCSLIIFWQLARLEWITLNSGDVAASWLMTPLWLPRLPMVIGMAVLVIVLAKAAVVDLRRMVAIRERKTR